MSVPKVVIKSWKFVEPQVDEEPGMPTYHLEGTCDGASFVCQISMEIDGRDVEFEHISGVNMDFAGPGAKWDGLLVAFENCVSLTADFSKRADEYRASY